jgi:hypothetical protein
MIDVKGTKTPKPETDESHEHYVLKSQDKRSNAPLFFTMLLTGFALYLKSAFPSLTGAVSEEAVSDAAEKPTPSSSKAATASDPDAGADVEANEREADRPMRSGERLIAHRDSSDFMLSDSPAIEFERLNLPSFALLRKFGGISVSCS